MAGAGLFQPENELEEAVLAAVRDGDRAGLLAALAHAEVYVPATGSGRDVQLATIERGGVSFIPVFTSLTRLRVIAPDGTGYMRVAGRGLASVRPQGVPVVVNPGSDVGTVLAPADVAELGSAPQPADPWLLVGEPAQEPEELLEAIRGLAEEEPAIRKAYRGLLLKRGAASSELVVGLELEEDVAREPVLEAVAAAARGAGLESLAVVIVDGDEPSDPVGRFLTGQTQPFYVREL